MKYLFTAFVMLVLAFVASMPAHAKGKCFDQSWGQNLLITSVTSQLGTDFAATLSFRKLPDELAANFVEALAEYPPETEPAGNGVVLMSSPYMREIIVMIMKDGCVVGVTDGEDNFDAFSLSPKLTQHLMQVALEKGSGA